MPKGGIWVRLFSLRPNYKFFLNASLEVRAKRRYEELIQRGQTVSLEEVKQEMETRDRQDQERTLAPLRPAPDAWVMDTSHLSIEDGGPIHSFPNSYEDHV